MIAAPPLFEGAVQESMTPPLCAVAPSEVGVPGIVRGVALIVAEYDPVPTPLTVATRKSNRVPLGRPVTTTPVVVLTGSTTVVQEASVLALNWMT